MDETLRKSCTLANDLVSLKTMVEILARKISVPDALLPSFGHSEQEGHPYVQHDPAGFHYLVEERGTVPEHRSSPDPFQVLGWIFKDITFSMACREEVNHRSRFKDARRYIFSYQLELLGQLDEIWKMERERDLVKILEKNPYHDSPEVITSPGAPQVPPPVPFPAPLKIDPSPLFPPNVPEIPPPLSLPGKNNRKSRLRLVCYGPLVFVVLGVIWNVFEFLCLIFSVGDMPYENTPAKEHLYAQISVIPYALGCILGIMTLLSFFPRSFLEWFCALLGTVLCGVLVLWILH